MPHYQCGVSWSHSPTLGLALKEEFRLDSLIRVYNHFVVDSHKTTGMVNTKKPKKISYEYDLPIVW